MLLDYLKTNCQYILSLLNIYLVFVFFIFVHIPPPGETVLHSSVGLVDPGENHPEQISTAVKSTRKVRLNESLKPPIT